VRYVDDFIILGDKEIYKETEKIRAFLKDKLDLKLSEKKIKFQQIDKGIDFLGYYIKPNYTLVRRKIIGRFKDKMYRLGEAKPKDVMATANSYFGHFIHADSFRLRKTIYEKYFKKDFRTNKKYKSIKTATRTK